MYDGSYVTTSNSYMPTSYNLSTTVIKTTQYNGPEIR